MTVARILIDMEEGGICSTSNIFKILELTFTVDDISNSIIVKGKSRNSWTLIIVLTRSV
ncbi:hypothetical protein R6Q59_014320 [Mikania micrantha]